MIGCMIAFRSALLTLLVITAHGQNLQTVTVTEDDTVISKSCIIRIAKGLVIQDTNNNGVLHIRGTDLEVTFEEGSILQGNSSATPGEKLGGIGVVATGAHRLHLHHAAISGFRVGVDIRDSDSVHLHHMILRNHWRQKLKSTPKAEVSSDWLSPHGNDDGEWLSRYAASLHLKSSKNSELHDILIREGQNGIILDRVNNSQVYDCDCSFLSGWGVAMWRSSGNLISRNALDFCIRGYSHKVYNRGQDSAGLLMFEQCNNNHILENSITHGGDGIFGFAGKEALAGTEPLGCNGNVFAGNDLSYAAAHGLEMTFSQGNVIRGNQFTENAICGIWGGYSFGTVIQGNQFSGNGDMAYGLERGGINIEHGGKNVIADNNFLDNHCGIHLWDDPDEHLKKEPWVKANDHGCKGEAIVGNRFIRDVLAIQIRGGTDILVANCSFEGCGESLVTESSSIRFMHDRSKIPALAPLERLSRGNRRPIGARKHLRGRHNIIMTADGPWDHKSKFARFVGFEQDTWAYEISGLGSAPGATILKTVDKGGPTISVQSGSGTQRPRVQIRATNPGVYPMTIQVSDGKDELVIDEVFTRFDWDLACFKSPAHPVEAEDEWYAGLSSATMARGVTNELNLPFHGGGPSQMNLGKEITETDLPRDQFGVIAKTRVQLPVGRWRCTTVSDDGIRVKVNGERVIDNWTWHGAAEDRGEFTVIGEAATEIIVEYFELDGAAMLSFKLEPLTN